MAKQAAMETRQKVHQLVVSGNITDAMRQVDENYPGLFVSRPDLLFRIKEQHFVEMVRLQEPTEELLKYCQGELQSRSPRESAGSGEVLSLLAYEEPDSSPVSHLLLPERRIAVAEVLNSAILEFQNEPKESRLRRLCEHALVVGETLHANEVPGSNLISIPELVRGHSDSSEA